MTNATASGSSINGLRTLELGAALLWLREQLLLRLGPGNRSISLSGVRNSEEQEILGMAQILIVMFPFVIELALKSLWDCFHEDGTYQRRHDLDVLFQSLDANSKDIDAARLAQKRARDIWVEFQNENKINYQGSLDEFLTEHARDFIDVRYYTQKPAKYLQIDDFVICLYCIIYPLAACEPDTFANLLGRATKVT